MKIILKSLGLCIAIIASNTVIRAQDSVKQARMDDLAFASKASAGNQFEIQSSTVALSKSQNQNIKQYAQMIVDDHTTAGNDLAKIVKGNNWQLMSADKQHYSQMVDQLSHADPANFDRMYTEMMVKSHEDAIALFRDATVGNNIRNSDLRQFALSKIPVFEKHLQQVKVMDPKEGPMDVAPNMPNKPVTAPNMPNKPVPAPNMPNKPVPALKGKLPTPIMK